MFAFAQQPAPAGQPAAASVPSAAIAASPAVQKNALPQATPIPEHLLPSAVSSVAPPDKQNGMERVQSLMGQPRRYMWKYWGDAPVPVKTFLAERDPKVLATIQPKDLTYFTTMDMDGDKLLDLIVRFGSGDSCAIGPNGCPFVIYFADKAKRRSIINARKVVPSKGSLIIQNNFYAIHPTGGDTYTAVSYRAFHIDDPFDPIAITLSQKLNKVFAGFYERNERTPAFRYALYDLNNDGKNEIILQIMEDEEQSENLCAKGDDLSCPVVIYSTSADNQPDTLLGFFRSRQDQLILGRGPGPGYADIITTSMINLSLRTFVYSMDAKTGQYVQR